MPISFHISSRQSQRSGHEDENKQRNCVGTEEELRGACVKCDEKARAYLLVFAVESANKDNMQQLPGSSIFMINSYLDSYFLESDK
jgi:hypothetical protein